MKKKKLIEYIQNSLSNIQDTSFNMILYNLCTVTETEEELIIEVPSSFFKKKLEEKNIANLLPKKCSIKINSSLATKEEEIKEEKKRILPKWGTLIGDSLNTEMTPKNFIVANNNTEAYHLSLQILSERKGSLVIYGVSGVGKTHLLHVIAWKALYSGLNIANFKSYNLAETISLAFKNKEIYDLKTQILEADVLLVDDFQHFNNPYLNNSRNFLFGIIDSFISFNKIIMVTSDVKPDSINWNHIEERIRQRLVLRGSTIIRPPESDFVISYIRYNLAQKGKTITKEAENILDRYNFNSIRELEDFVWSLYNLKKEIITYEDLEFLLTKESFNKNIMKNSSLNIIWKNCISSLFSDPLVVDDILRGRKQTKEVIKLKKIFTKVAAEKNFRTTEIAKFFGVSPQTISNWKRRVPNDNKTKILMQHIKKFF